VQVFIPRDSRCLGPFDHMRRFDVTGEWWDAREVMQHLGYKTWRGSQTVLRRAKSACRNISQCVEEHFQESKEPKGPGRTGRRASVRLSRFAMSLVAMNGKSSKPQVAAAQIYFVERTIHAERMQSGASQ
jgi:DNA-damage-inducible protein D